MTVHNLEHANSILNNFLKELRSGEIQQDTLRFRFNIERIAELLAYEMSKTLSFVNEAVVSPLGKKNMQVFDGSLVIGSVLRAGLTMHNGLLRIFDRAENAFISAYRHHENDEDNFEVIVNYMASPRLENKTLLLADPMLATGKTLENVLHATKEYGEPRQIHILSVIGTEQGIAHVKQVFPEDTQLWIATIDADLTNRGYIVPGLGDAGDLAYGNKL